MVAKIAIIFMAIIAAATMFGWIDISTFSDLWQQAFVVAIKSTLLAMIPGGFLIAVYSKL